MFFLKIPQTQFFQIFSDGDNFIYLYDIVFNSKQNFTTENVKTDKN